MPRTADLSKLSREALEGAFLQLIKEGQLAPADVRKAAAKAEQIAELKAKIAALEGGESGRRGPGRPPKAKAADKKPRRKIKLSPEARKLRQRQGVYMGLLRGLSKRDQARVKAENKKKGVEAAIALAEKLKAGAGDVAGAKAAKPAGKKRKAKKTASRKAATKKTAPKKAVAEAKPKVEGETAQG